MLLRMNMCLAQICHASLPRGTKGVDDRGWAIRTFFVVNRVYMNIQRHFPDSRNIESSIGERAGVGGAI